RTTQFVASDALRKERRRQQREQEAYMQSELDRETSETRGWQAMFPLLDDAIAALRQTDRDALALRYFQDQSLEQVGKALGLTERAAQKRVWRSVEKLRSFFVKRGVVVSSAAIASALAAHSVQAAPAGMAGSALAAATQATAAAAPVALAEAGLSLMALAKLKSVLGLAAGFAIVIASGTVGVVGLTTALRPVG